MTYTKELLQTSRDNGVVREGADGLENHPLAPVKRHQELLEWTYKTGWRTR